MSCRVCKVSRFAKAFRERGASLKINGAVTSAGFAFCFLFGRSPAEFFLADEDVRVCGDCFAPVITLLGLLEQLQSVAKLMGAPCLCDSKLGVTLHPHPPIQIYRRRHAACRAPDCHHSVAYFPEHRRHNQLYQLAQRAGWRLLSGALLAAVHAGYLPPCTGQLS